MLARRADASYVLHRVIQVQARSFSLMGDAQTEVEEGFQEADLVARVDAWYHGKRMIRTDVPFVRALAGVWLFLRPLRPILLSVAVRLVHLVRRLMHGKNTIDVATD